MNYFRRYSVLDSICLGKEKGVAAHHRNPWFSLWWRRGDLNSRPPPCEGDALPAELLPHMDATTRRSEVCMPFICRGQVFFASSRPSARREELNAATGTGQATTKLAPQGEWHVFTPYPLKWEWARYVHACRSLHFF